MKRTILLSALFLLLANLSIAGSPLTRKIGQKFFDASRELRLTAETEVIVLVHVNEEGAIRILETNTEDEKINAFVKIKMESIKLNSETTPGIYRYKLVFKPFGK
jgi:hypothetical protein